MSHSTRQMNWAPNLDKVGQAATTSEAMMPSKATSTSMENNHVVAWKTVSCNR